MQFTLASRTSHWLICNGLLFAIALTSALCFTQSLAVADSAYINQATGAAGQNPQALVRALPIATMPVSPPAPRSIAFVPTPETVGTPGRSLNLAQTLEIGRNNQVAQFQAGQNNFSNVGVVGGAGNNVGVLQGGGDLSNLYLVNTQGLSIGVLQPKGAAPLNMLIARLPNGALLIKK